MGARQQTEQGDAVEVGVSLLYGRDLTEAGGTHVQLVSDRVVVAGTAGLQPAKKQDRNEDVVAYLALGDAEAVVLADGHFGRTAAEIAVDTCVAELVRSRLSFTQPEAALSLILAAAEERICTELAPSFRNLDSSPECSLLVFLRRGSQGFLGSVGDSYALRLPAAGAPEALAPLQRSWMGVGSALRSRCPSCEGVRSVAKELGIGFWSRGNAERACAMRRPLSDHYHGSFPVRPGDSFMLTTDGLIEGRENGEESIRFGLLKAGGSPLDEVAREILQGALSTGCPDNVAFVLLLPAS